MPLPPPLRFSYFGSSSPRTCSPGGLSPSKVLSISAYKYPLLPGEARAAAAAWPPAPNPTLPTRSAAAKSCPVSRAAWIPLGLSHKPQPRVDPGCICGHGALWHRLALIRGLQPKRGPGGWIFSSLVCWGDMASGTGKEVLPVDEAVPSVQATLVDKTDAFLEVPLASRKNKPDRIRTSGTEQDF